MQLFLGTKDVSVPLIKAVSMRWEAYCKWSWQHTFRQAAVKSQQ